MGFKDFLNPRRAMYKDAPQRPGDSETVAQIVGIKPKGDDLAVLDILVFPEEVSVWQPPIQRTLRTIVPDGVEPRIGQRVMIGSGGRGDSGGSNAPPPVFWDRPEPDPVPMQFPNIPGGQDPQVMLKHLEYLVQNKALTQEQYDAAKAYLDSGGWPSMT
jgi:hypothetical protein